MSPTNDHKIRKSLVKFIKAASTDRNVDLLQEVDYETKCSRGDAQRVLYQMLAEGMVRVGPGCVIELIEPRLALA